MGLGGNYEERFSYCDRKDRGRINAYITQYYQIHTSYSIGIEAQTSGRIFSIIGGSPVCDGYNDASNTRYLNQNNLNASSFFIRNRYIFARQEELRLYVDLGLGINTFFTNNPTAGISRLGKSTLALSPEVGLQLSRFQLSCKFILGGKTPGFNGFVAAQNENVVMKSIPVQQLYLSLGFNLFRF